MCRQDHVVIFFNCLSFSVLATFGDNTYQSLCFFPVKMLNLDAIFFCATIHNTTRKVSFKHVGKSFKICSFNCSSK